MSGRVSARTNRVRQLAFFTDDAIESGTASLPEDTGQDVQSRHVWMGNIGNMPGEVHLCQFRLKFLVSVSAPELLRLRRDNHRCIDLAGKGFEMSRDLGSDSLRIHRTYDDK